MSNYTKLAVKAAIIVFIMTVFTSIFSYLIRILLARKLTVAEYGLVYAIFSLFGLFSLLKTLGLPTALTKFTAEFKTKKQVKEIKSSILATSIILVSLGALLTLFFFLTSNFFAAYYFKTPIASLLIKIHSFTFILSAILSIPSAVFRGYQKQFSFSSMEFVKETTFFIATYLLLIFNFHIFSPMIAGIIAFLVEIIVFFPIFFKKTMPNFFKIKSHLNKPIFKKLIYFGLPVIFTGIAGKVFSHVDIIMLTYFRSLEEVGLYNAAMPTSKMLWRLGAILVVILLPLSTELWNKKEFKRLREGISFLYKYLYIIIFPSAIVLFLFPKIVLSLLFGEAYLGAVYALRILSVGAIFIVLSKINFSMLTGFGHPKFVAKTTITTAIINLIGNLILIPLIGIEGAAISTSISFFLMFLFSFSKLKKSVKSEFPWMTLAKITLAGLIFALVIVLLKAFLFLNIWIELILVLSIAGFIYLSLIFLFKIITFTEIKLILNRLK